MIVNGVQLPDPDTGDVIFMEKFEKECDLISQKANDIQGMTRAQAIRRQCEAIFTFFDNVFGKGAAKKIFGETVNLTVCVDAYDQAITEINRVDAVLASRLKAKYNAKYPAQMNRKKKKNRYHNHKRRS